MKKNITIILFLLLPFIGAKAQGTLQSKIDSLSNILQNYNIADTTRVNLMAEVGYEYSNVAPEKGAQISREGKEIAKKINYTKGLAKCLNSEGVCCFQKGQYSLAIDLFYQALKINEVIDNKKELVKNYGNIGRIFKIEDNFKKALEYLKKSNEITLAIGDKLGEYKSYINIGSLYVEHDSNKIAYEYFIKARIIANEIHYNEGIARTELMIGEVHRHLGYYNEMMKNYQHALEMYSAQNNKQAIAMLLSNIVEFYSTSLKKGIALKNVHFISGAPITEKAILEYADEGVKIGLELGANKELYKLYLSLSEIYSYKKDWTKAYKYLELYRIHYDSVFNSENQAKLFQLASQFDSDIKEKRISGLEITNNFNGALLILLIISAVLLASVIIVISFFLVKLRKNNALLNSQNLFIQESKQELEDLNRDLMSREKELQVSNNAKNMFISIIAHDINNPLHSILLSGDFLRMYYNKLSPDKVESSIDSILNSARGLSALLKNLLEWARAEKGQIDFQPVELNIYDVVEQNINFNAENALNKKISLVNEIQPEETIYADSNMLNTVIRNLISNAIKFTKDSGLIRITVNEIEDGLKKQISVIDSGVGMSPATLKSLFNIESHYSALGTNQEKGSGFGLKICKEFVEKHGGSIWAESELGAGSIFNFTLRSKKH